MYTDDPEAASESLSRIAGWDFEPAICESPDLVEQGYASGVPMGSVLGAPPQPDSTPRFVMIADRDQVDLQRAQIVKLSVSADGELMEDVFPIAGGDNGASVDPQTCEPQGTGAATLCGVWEDSQFDPEQPAAYYVRVLENPTCRWSQRDCNALPPPQRPEACDDLPVALQERAWTSPIWIGGAQ